MCPVLPVLLELVRGPERLPADEELQEMLRGKLRILQADSDEVKAVFMVKTTQKIPTRTRRSSMATWWRHPLARVIGGPNPFQ